MVFKRLKARFGGGTTIDAVVRTPVAVPGHPVEGVVEVVGGEFEQEISYVEMVLQARVEVETDDGEHDADKRFAGQRVTGPFTLSPGEHRSLPFSFLLPLQTPFTVLGPHELPKVRVGLRTELEIARSTDKTDLDPLRVAAPPVADRICSALERIGCRFLRSDLEASRVPGAEMPFVQEVEFAPPPGLNTAEVEVVFLAGPHATDVLLVGDRKAGGFFDGGGDTTQRFTVGHDALGQDWESELRNRLAELGRRRGLFG
jgi:sporulation-control protein